jgi:hypothetical protein
MAGLQPITRSDANAFSGADAPPQLSVGTRLALPSSAGMEAAEERGKAAVRFTHSKCGLGGWPGPHFFLAFSYQPSEHAQRLSIPRLNSGNRPGIDVSLIIRLYSRADSLTQFTGPEKMNFARVFRNRSRVFTGFARVLSPSPCLKFSAEKTKTI